MAKPPRTIGIEAISTMTYRACRPAAFLDRDGVINVDVGYAHRPDQLAFTPTAVDAILELNRAGYWVIVVTNQSGVARGFFDLADVEAFHAEIVRRLAKRGGRIDAFYVAPYHPEGLVPEFSCEHEDRKPGAGMLMRAMADWPIDREASFLVGDKASDIEAARRAGIEGIMIPSDTGDLAAVVAARLAAARSRRGPSMMDDDRP